MTSPTVSIVVPVHNAVGESLNCLSSLLSTIDPKVHHVYVIDDASERTTSVRLSRFVADNPQITLSRNETRRGFSKCVNQGIKANNRDVVIILNSDTIVTEGWIYKLADALFSSPRIGIVGPLSNAASHQSILRSRPNFAEKLVRQTAINAIPRNLTLESINSSLDKIPWERVLRAPLVHGFCFAIKKETARSVGLFEENLLPHGFGAEVDYCLRANELGWELAWVLNCYVWHSKSASHSTLRRLIGVAAGKQALSNKYGSDSLRKVKSSATQLSDWVVGSVKAHCPELDLDYRGRTKPSLVAQGNSTHLRRVRYFPKRQRGQSW